MGTGGSSFFHLGNGVMRGEGKGGINCQKSSGGKTALTDRDLGRELPDDFTRPWDFPPSSIQVGLLFYFVTPTSSPALPPSSYVEDGWHFASRNKDYLRSVMSDDFFLRDGGGGEVSTSSSDTDFSVMWPATCTLLFDEVHSLKTTTGLQLAVRHKSASLNVAMGKAVTPPRGDTPMTPDTLCDWQSTTKAITAIAVAVAHEKRIVDVFQPVATYWPEFRKHDVTLAHCLTHVAGLAFAGIRLVPEQSTKEDICAAIADAQPEHEPGEKACYHPYSGCYIVAECVERASGVPWSDFVRENVLKPLGVADNILLCFPTEDTFTAFKPRLAELVSRPDDTLSYADVMNHPCPASGMRATAGAVADVMACLARGGAPILKTDTLMMFTRRHRIGMLDELQGRRSNPPPMVWSGGGG